jgi:branched-chain amino acid transport system substrate-binding protein
LALRNAFILRRRRARRKEIKIGFSMAMTGRSAANGKSALLGMQIWEEQTNKKGGLLGRPSSSSITTTRPTLDRARHLHQADRRRQSRSRDRPYATNMIAPAMPVVMQKGKVFVAVFGLAVNSEFNYPKYFAMIPTGQNTKPSFTEGFFEVAAQQNPKPQTVAIVGGGCRVCA